MIFNNNQIYAKVWKVTPSEKYIDLQITTSEKKQDSDEYEHSSWFPRVIGHAFNSLKDVQPKDKIVITKSKFTNVRYQNENGEWRSSFRFVILEAKKDDVDTQQSESNESPQANNVSQEQKEECPW